MFCKHCVKNVNAIAEMVHSIVLETPAYLGNLNPRSTMKITKCYFKFKSLSRNQRILSASLQSQKHLFILSIVGEQISTTSPRNHLLELLLHVSKNQSSSCFSTGLPLTPKTFRARQQFIFREQPHE